jgi:hypothetical protein
MTINANLLAALVPIVSHTRGPNGGVFANPKGPLIKALEKEGYIEGDAANKNPADANQIAYKATAKGLAEVPVASDAAPAAPQEGQEAPATPQEPASAPAAGADANAPKKRGPKGKRDPNAPPTVIKREIGFRMPMPVAAAVTVRRGPRDKYGFADLLPPTPEGLDSFFVEANSKLTNPAKSLGGNVNKANKKFAKGTPEGGATGRKFKIVPVEVDAQFGVAGARVLRIE